MGQAGPYPDAYNGDMEPGEHDPWVEGMSFVAEIFDLCGVGVLVIAFVLATLVFFKNVLSRQKVAEAIEAYKRHIGRGMVLGLEVLIAADIIKTVAVEATVDNMLALGLLIIVRTFLSWSLALETEGRWPWQPEPLGDRAGDEAGGREPRKDGDS